MTFSSKKDLWLGIIVWFLNILFTWILYQSILVSFNFTGIIIAIIMIYLLSTIWFKTNYKIENNKLRITYGPYRKIIDIEKINSIRETTNPFVSPSLSIYRIEITYGKYETISISPLDKKGLIKELQAVNSNIEIRTE